MNILKKSLIVETELVSAKTKYTFSDQPSLDGKKIRGLIISPNGIKSKTGRDVVDPRSAYLYFQQRDKETPVEIPAGNLLATFGAPLLQIIPLDMEKIDWVRSSIEFKDTAVVSSSVSFQMVVIYED